MNGLLLAGVIGKGLESFVTSYNATKQNQREQAEADETLALRRRQMAGQDYDSGRQWDDETKSYKPSEGGGDINPREQKQLSRLIEMQKAAGENWYRKEYDAPRNAMKALSGKLYGAGGEQQPTGGLIESTPSMSVEPTGSGLVKQPGLISAPAPMAPKAPVRPRAVSPVAARPTAPAPSASVQPGIVNYNPKDWSDGYVPKEARQQMEKRSEEARKPMLKQKEDMASAIVTKKSIANAMVSLLDQLDDPNISDDDKLIASQESIKMLNSQFGKDAVGAEESQRLAGWLEFHVIPNFTKPGPILGRAPISKFRNQVANNLSRFNESIKADEELMNNPNAPVRQPKVMTQTEAVNPGIPESDWAQIPVEQRGEFTRQYREKHGAKKR